MAGASKIGGSLQVVDILAALEDARGGIRDCHVGSASIELSFNGAKASLEIAIRLSKALRIDGRALHSGVKSSLSREEGVIALMRGPANSVAVRRCSSSARCGDCCSYRSGQRALNVPECAGAL